MTLQAVLVGPDLYSSNCCFHVMTIVITTLFLAFQLLRQNVSGLLITTWQAEEPWRAESWLARALAGRAKD